MTMTNWKASDTTVEFLLDIYLTSGIVPAPGFMQTITEVA